MSPSTMPTPLYSRVFAVLKHRIDRGDYGPGELLPTEDQLTEEFSVSKATIRKAVGELVALGFVVRKQGKGTFVQDGPAIDRRRVFVGSLVDLVGGTPKLPVHDFEIEYDARFPRTVCQDFRGRITKGIIVRNRRTMDGAFFVHSVHYLAPDLDFALDEARLQEEGLVNLLHDAGIELTGAEQSVTAEMADVEVAERLDIGLASPVLFSKRVLESHDKIIDVLHSWYRGDLYEWRSRQVVTTRDGNVMFTPAEGL